MSKHDHTPFVFSCKACLRTPTRALRKACSALAFCAIVCHVSCHLRLAVPFFVSPDKQTDTSARWSTNDDLVIIRG